MIPPYWTRLLSFPFSLLATPNPFHINSLKSVFMPFQFDVKPMQGPLWIIKNCRSLEWRTKIVVWNHPSCAILIIWQTSGSWIWKWLSGPWQHRWIQRNRQQRRNSLEQWRCRRNSWRWLNHLQKRGWLGSSGVSATSITAICDERVLRRWRNRRVLRTNQTRGLCTRPGPGQAGLRS